MPRLIRWCPAVIGLLACASSPKPAPANAAAPPLTSGTEAKAATAPSPAGGKEALAAIREIQAQPLRDDEEAKEKFTAVLRWLSETPDITVVVCGGLLPLREPAGPHDGKLLIQLMFAQAAYQLEHPGVAPKDEAVLTAGLAGALHAYRMLLAEHPEQSYPAWDQLDAAERNGALSPHVRTVLQGCSKN